ncbi:MAG: hypothetical protein Q7K42_02870 [Candidatus Diapherotrites archaeon]|nr:hypothetical protein [Candidatus Diapherotrites archaeon]
MPEPKTKQVEEKKENGNLKPALAYLPILPLIAPLFFFFTSGQDKKLKFHALQALILEIIITVLSLVVFGIALTIMQASLVGFIILIVFSSAFFIFFAIMFIILAKIAWHVYKGQPARVPIIAGIAEMISGKQ